MHLDVAKSYNNIGKVYHAKGDYIEALSNFNKSLNISLQLHNDNYLYTSTIYENIGNTYNSLDNLELATINY